MQKLQASIHRVEYDININMSHVGLRSSARLIYLGPIPPQPRTGRH